ncbi:unnamed protein product [Schistosoma margrebowiei]|uniref:Uncharacterized protein n=1 Tax=Schistosoma margrebowiei TaxID=48269 RepID=A0A3P7WJ76_9TREM|nr:unnamed protein product [Schistosoma margrebowiei]
MMGDLKAKVRIDNTGYEYIMGRHGLGEKDENGERFADLCVINKLVIGGTVFPHKRIHKATWISQDHTTVNHINHICINKKFRRIMKDVRKRRGADIASDNHPIVANLKLKLKKNWTTGQTALQIQRIQDSSQQQVPSFTRSTEGKRNYFGGQMGRHQ